MLSLDISHLQTLDRAISVATRMTEETLSPHLVLTSDHDRYFVLHAEDFDPLSYAPTAAPDVVVHLQL